MGVLWGRYPAINTVIESIRSILDTECKEKSMPKCRAYMMLIGKLRWAYGYWHRSSILCCVCRRLQEQWSFQNDPPLTLKSRVRHDNQQHSGEEAVVLTPNWEPANSKLTKGGRLLIPRGVQFGPGLFPEIVIPRNHVGLLVNSATWQEVPFQIIGPFQAIDTIFPGLPGDLELFTAKEVAKLKELGILNLPNIPEHLLLFPPLVPSSRGKVVSATLGTPTPDLDAHDIGQSLVTDGDEESVISDSYSDRHSITTDSSTIWGRQIRA